MASIAAYFDLTRYVPLTSQEDVLVLQFITAIVFGVIGFGLSVIRA